MDFSVQVSDSCRDGQMLHFVRNMRWAAPPSCLLGLPLTSLPRDERLDRPHTSRAGGAIGRKFLKREDCLQEELGLFVFPRSFFLSFLPSFFLSVFLSVFFFFISPLPKCFLFNLRRVSKRPEQNQKSHRLPQECIFGLNTLCAKDNPIPCDFQAPDATPQQTGGAPKQGDSRQGSPYRNLVAWVSLILSLIL